MKDWENSTTTLTILVTPYHLGIRAKVAHGVIPLGPEVTEDPRIHLMWIKSANKKLHAKVEYLSSNIAGVEDRLNVRLAMSDRQRDDSLRVVTESLNRLTMVVQRLEARDARIW